MNFGKRGIRVGHGYDVHRFDLQNSGPCQIRLGGVDVPSEHAIIAHSDGDVLIHALCDALLGAMGVGDIGEQFPDTDPQYSGADSRDFLAKVMTMLKSRGGQLINIDISIIAQQPKVSPFKDLMKASLSRDLSCPPDRLNIKATTTEGLGPFGRGEGIACHALVLIDYG